MTLIDWLIIASYLVGMIALSAYLGHSQDDEADYYLGGRNLPWWAVGISTMATQSSAISFVSIPAFVALAPGGGLRFLQWEIAVPIAMIFVMSVLAPALRKLEVVSIYRYAEMRFGKDTRYLLSAMFLLARGLATGVALYASALVLEVCLGLPVWANILLLGVVTVIYDTLGGMAAVVYSDVIQLFVLLAGLGLCIYYAIDIAGGWEVAVAGLSAEQRVVFDPSFGLDGESKAPLWPFLIGGFFLYASYYGTDQSQAQRLMSVPDEGALRKSILFNGLARFPLISLYVIVGVGAAAALTHSPELQASMAGQKADTLVLELILQTFPSGARGLVFAALLAAAMSSLDSALNSLSASTMRDFVDQFWEVDEAHGARIARVVTVAWGVLITAFAFVFAALSNNTVIEVINKVGSAFYGPVLAVFTFGLLTRHWHRLGVWFGVVAGIATNLCLWIFAPDLHWMWWNIIGFGVTGLVGFISALLVEHEQAPASAAESETVELSPAFGSFKDWLAAEKPWWRYHAALWGYVVLMLAILGFLHV